MVAISILQVLAKFIGHQIPKGTFFALITFDESATPSNLQHISNAERASIVKALRECADKIESEQN